MASSFAESISPSSWLSFSSSLLTDHLPPSIQNLLVIPSPPLSILIPVSLLTIYLISCIRSHRRLSAFPAPPTASFSYFWLIKTLYSGRMGARLRDLSERFYPETQTVRIGPNDLMTCDPALLKRISAARSRYARSEWYRLSRLDPYDDAMLSTLDGKKHDEIKAMTAPGYSGRDSGGQRQGQETERIIDKAIATVVRVIRERYAAAAAASPPGVSGNGKMVDLASMSQYFTLDSIAEIAFGMEWGLVEAEEDVIGTMETIEDMAPGAVVVSGVPYLRAVMGSDLALKLLGPSVKDKKGIGKMMHMAREIVGARFREHDKVVKNDMLGSFIRHGMTQRQCETEALIQIIAGSDTTATAIRATLLFIMTTPRVYHRMRKEIEDGIRAGKISNPITYAEGSELPYLQGVILEGLRLHPPFTGIPSKVVPPEGDTIDGKFVPGGTRISPSIWATGRHKGVFGEDANIFRPERWIPNNQSPEERERLAEMRRVAELVFGYGRWGCAGKVIAFMELNKIFVELLRHFDLQLVYPYDPWKSTNYNLFLQHDMWVSVTLRE